MSSKSDWVPLSARAHPDERKFITRAAALEDTDRADFMVKASLLRAADLLGEPIPEVNGREWKPALSEA